MIDFFDAIFAGIRAAAETVSDSVTVREESEAKPSVFPCVTVQEADNSTTNLDSSQREKYAAVQYKIRVFTNRSSGKRREAMKLFQAIDLWLIKSNFTRKNICKTPDMYQSTLYQITAVYEAVIGENGHIYTRR